MDISTSVKQSRSGTLKRRLSRIFSSNGIQSTFKEKDDPFATHYETTRARRESAVDVTRRKSFFASLKRNKTLSFGSSPISPALYIPEPADSRYSTIRGDKPKGARLPSDATLRSSFEDLDRPNTMRSSSSSSLQLNTRPALPSQPIVHSTPAPSFAMSLNKSKTLSLKKDPDYDGTMTIRRSKEWGTFAFSSSNLDVLTNL